MPSHEVIEHAGRRAVEEEMAPLVLDPRDLGGGEVAGVGDVEDEPVALDEPEVAVRIGAARRAVGRAGLGRRRPRHGRVAAHEVERVGVRVVARGGGRRASSSDGAEAAGARRRTDERRRQGRSGQGRRRTVDRGRQPFPGQQRAGRIVVPVRQRGDGAVQLPPRPARRRRRPERARSRSAPAERESRAPRLPPPTPASRSSDGARSAPRRRRIPRRLPRPRRAGRPAPARTPRGRPWHGHARRRRRRAARADTPRRRGAAARAAAGTPAARPVVMMPGPAARGADRGDESEEVGSEKRLASDQHDQARPVYRDRCEALRQLGRLDPRRRRRRIDRTRAASVAAGRAGPDEQRIVPRSHDQSGSPDVIGKRIALTGGGRHTRASFRTRVASRRRSARLPGARDRTHRRLASSRSGARRTPDFARR